MRLMAVSVFLVLMAAMAAYMLRPGEAQHRGVALALSGAGRIDPAPAGSRFVFEDFLVLTRSRVLFGDRVQLDCWGAYTRFLCMGEERSAAGPDPAPG